MSDPTYVTADIEKNPVWHAAFILSECLNDGAPIGWGRYIFVAEALEKSGLLARGTAVQEQTGPSRDEWVKHAASKYGFDVAPFLPGATRGQEQPE